MTGRYRRLIAADQGFSEAQYSVGIMDAQGLGRAEDRGFAVRCLCRCLGLSRDRLAVRRRP